VPFNFALRHGLLTPFLYRCCHYFTADVADVHLRFCHYFSISRTSPSAMTAPISSIFFDALAMIFLIFALRTLLAFLFSR